MIDKYSSNEFNKVFVLQLLYTIQNKQNVECRMFSREKSLNWASKRRRNSYHYYSRFVSRNIWSIPGVTARYTRSGRLSKKPNRLDL